MQARQGFVADREGDGLRGASVDVGEGVREAAGVQVGLLGDCEGGWDAGELVAALTF